MKRIQHKCVYASIYRYSVVVVEGVVVAQACTQRQGTSHLVSRSYTIAVTIPRNCCWNEIEELRMRLAVLLFAILRYPVYAPFLGLFQQQLKTPDAYRTEHAVYIGPHEEYVVTMNVTDYGVKL